MLAQERHEQIMQILRSEKRFIRITELVERFHISNETARRDLSALQAKGLVKRVHGGGVLCEQAPQEDTPFADQPALDYTVKQSIGALAASLVEDGDTIFLGSGSTMHEIARHLPDLSNLTVLTISLPVAMELAGRRCSVIVLGGRIDQNEYCLSGILTNCNLRQFFVDKAFFGASGVTMAHGVTDFGVDRTMQHCWSTPGRRSSAPRAANLVLPVFLPSARFLPCIRLSATSSCRQPLPMSSGSGIFLFCWQRWREPQTERARTKLYDALPLRAVGLILAKSKGCDNCRFLTSGREHCMMGKIMVFANFAFAV